MEVGDQADALGEIALREVVRRAAAVVDDEQLRSRAEDVIEVGARLAGRVLRPLALIVGRDDEREWWLRGGDGAPPGRCEAGPLVADPATGVEASALRSLPGAGRRAFVPSMSAPGDRDGIEAEARAFARYLARMAPPPGLGERYAGAVERLLPGAETPAEHALLVFARRHPWSVAYLDAAAALVARHGRLRARLLVMAALLETTPEGAAEFLPRERGLGALALALPTIALRALWHTLAGLVVYALAVTRA